MDFGKYRTNEKFILANLSNFILPISIILGFLTELTAGNYDPF